MQKGSVLFYHNHISTNIDKVDKRAQGYIKHRKQFLRKYCQPLDEKIQKLDKEIEFYNHLIENQNEMIQNEDQVAKLKIEINEFLDTQKYFLSHLEQYQENIVNLTMENKIIEGKIKRIKSDIIGITKRKTDQVYNELSERDNRSIKTGALNYSKVSKLSDRMSQSKSSQNNHSKYHYQPQKQILLPTIFKVEKYYVNKETQKIKEKIHFFDVIKNRQQKSFTFDVALSNNLDKSEVLESTRLKKEKEQKTSGINKMQEKNEPQISVQLKSFKKQKSQKQLELKSRFKQLMTNFNKFQLLFKQCFQKKKSHVQKSVRQLQSKLISNRDRFLQICQAISQKNIKKLPFELFSTMSSDEIMTLMISYPWLQKKLFKELTERRKNIIQLQVNNKFIC